MLAEHAHCALYFGSRCMATDDENPKRGRPPIDPSDQLRVAIRLDVEDSTAKAVEAEMAASGQARSKVMRRLIREALRARGYDLPESHDEKRSREKEEEA